MRVSLIMAVVAVLALSFGGGHVAAAAPTAPTIKPEVVYHGGGCRKSSPPGQCCHMDHSTGIVHCH